MATFTPIVYAEDALPNEAMAHPKAVLRVEGKRIRIHTYDGADKDFNPVFTTTTYVSFDAALKDIKRWHKDRRRQAR